MKRTASLFIGAALLAASAILPLAAMAQTNQAMMPTLYDQSGNPVNAGTAAVPAGYYYLSTGSQHQVYYYGNGTYYDASIGQYGGSISNPNGTSGAGLGYVNSSSVIASVPGVPNTGFGGDASGNWTLLIVSGVVTLVGAAFLAYSFAGRRMA